MNPIDLIPLADTIPVHWGWFKALLTVTFFLHLLLMNVMVGGAVISWCTRQQPQSELIGGIVSRNLPFLIPFTINFGVAPFLFLQLLYGNFIYVSSQLMAVFWVSMFVLLMIAYYAAYYYKYHYDRLQAGSGKRLLSVIILLFLLIGFIFSNNMTLMISPDAWPRYFDNARGTILNLSDPTLMPRFLHFMLASVAIGGLFIAIAGLRKQKTNPAHAQLLIQLGMKWFTYTTLIQIVGGFWFQFSLPRPVLLLFMGHSPTHTAVFIISLLFTGGAVYAGILNRVKTAAVFALSLVFIMIIMRDMVRSAYLAPYFQPEQLVVTHQYGSLILFLISLALGIAAIAYLFTAVRRSSETVNLNNKKWRKT